MSKKYLILTLFIFLFFYSFNQNTLLNEAKYWVCQDRLINDFTMYHLNMSVLHEIEIYDITKQITICKKIESNNNIIISWSIS